MWLSGTLRAFQLECWLLDRCCMRFFTPVSLLLFSSPQCAIDLGGIQFVLLSPALLCHGRALVFSWWMVTVDLVSVLGFDCACRFGFSSGAVVWGSRSPVQGKVGLVDCMFMG